MLVVMSPQHRYHVSLFVMRVIMAATFLGLRNFVSFLLLTMCFSSSVIGQSAYTDETMFFLLQRALMFHSSSTYHYLEQTWLYVFAVALERFNHLYGYREKSWTTLFPAGCPSLCCEFWLYACSILLFHNPNWTGKRCRSQGLHPRRAICYSRSELPVV